MIEHLERFSGCFFHMAKCVISDTLTLNAYIEFRIISRILHEIIQIYRKFNDDQLVEH